MADAKVGILIEAEDRASSTLTGIRGKLNDMQPAFKKMAAAGTAAFGAITAVGLTSITAYQEAERSARQLEHAVLDISKGTKEQVKAIDDLSDALQKKVGIDGDALKAGAAQLSTFGLQSKSVVDLTKSLADLTVNQNGIAASSDMYVQSANVMAKALNGQFGVLEKSGIRFTEAQQQLILFGTETQKVAALQEGLAQNLRETTDTLAGTSEASMAVAKQSFGELQEAIGKALVPALASLLEKVTPIIEKFGAWAAANPDLLAKILLVTAAIVGTVAVVGFLGLALPAVIAGFALLGSTVFLAALPFIAIGALFVYLAQVMKDQIGALYGVEVTWKDVWKGIKDAFTAVTDYIADKILWVMQKIEAVKNAFASAMAAVSKSVPVFGNSAVGGLGGSGYVNPNAGMFGGAFGGSVKDGVLQNGKIISTDPADTIIAMKDPSALGKGGSGSREINININGAILSQEAAVTLGDMILSQLRLQMRI